MRKPGIEPGAQRWQRWILPLNHLRCNELQLMPPARIELATFALQVQRSTTKLRRPN